MVDLGAVRRTIEAMPPKGRVAMVTRNWLEEVEKDLAELAKLKGQEASQS